MKNYGKFIAWLIAVWFLFVLSASALHLFENNSNRIGLAVAIAAVTPIVVFFLWLAASESFQRFAFSLNPRILTSAQAWRMVGFTFVLLEARGALPAIFALPAGYGDMAIGATASFVAIAWHCRPGDCREPGNNRGLDQPARPVDGPDDDAAIELNSHVPCAAVCDFSRYLHCPGKVLESRFGDRSSDYEADAVSRDLIIDFGESRTTRKTTKGELATWLSGVRRGRWRRA